MEYQTDADAQGNWELIIYDELDVGLHSISVRDNFNNEDNTLFKIQGAIPVETTQIDDVQTKESIVIQISGELAQTAVYSSLSLLAVMIGILVFNYFVADKIRVKKSGSKDITKKFAKKIMISSATLVAIMSVLILIISYRFISLNLVKSPISLKGIEEKVEVLVPSSGILRDPISLEPIAGVTMSAGDLTIETVEGGVFNFTDVNPNVGLLIKHADLIKPITYKPILQGYLDLLYNNQMMNAVIGSEDSASQTLIVLSVERIGELESTVSEDVYFNVIRVTTQRGEEKVVYNLIFTGKDWRIVF